MEPLFRQILVPIDGSEPSLQAIQMALRFLAVCPACKMTVLYVIDDLVLNELVRFSKHGEKEVEAELEQQGSRYLQLARKDAERQGLGRVPDAPGRPFRRGDRRRPRAARRPDHHGTYGPARDQPGADRVGHRARARLCFLPGPRHEVKRLSGFAGFRHDQNPAGRYPGHAREFYRCGRQKRVQTRSALNIGKREGTK